MANKHFLLICLGAKGHINPTLHFAKNLLRIEADVTLLLTISSARRIEQETELGDRFTVVTFSDGYDNGLKGDDVDNFLAEFRRRGREALYNLVVSRARDGRPFTCIVHTLLLHWAYEVARELHVPSALLWVQSAISFVIHYHFFNGYEEAIRRNKDDPSILVQFPGLPLLSNSELPSILISEKHRRYALEFEELFETFGKETKKNVLLNTFDALEHEAITAMGDEKVNMIPIGPLNPSTTKSDRHKEEIEWLNLQPISSVVYVSFGSFFILPKKQREELARGLLDSRYPFLWVVRANENRDEKEEIKMNSAMDEAMKKGKVVAWCSQVDVLNHPSVGCFVTHCGWNSTMETLVAGVPVVAFPQWADQGTNSKMMEDVWKIGVKAKANGNGVVEGKEIMRCLEKVMGNGGRGVEVRENAKKWKALAWEGASGSELNLMAFVNGV